jgi:DNA invertase Pin-like site-specific DNA recombinase
MRTVGYLYRSLTHEQTVAIRRARRDGVPARTLAAEYHVHIRTIYRTLERDGCDVRSITLDGWRAQFEMTDEGPVRVTPWFSDDGVVTP